MAALQKLQQIRKLKQAMIDAVRHGAMMYANGQGGKPIVDQHFAKGNDARYHFPALSEKYAKWKAKNTKKGTPMLTLTGETRKTVNSKTHTVTMRGGNALIIFRNLTEWATYLHEGTDRMPERSPVKPDDKDREQVIEHMKAYINRATGRGTVK